jgi:hypothetical protein
VNVHPSGSWTLRYRLASDRGLQGFADITTGQGDVPVALVRGSKLALESGRHQEFAVTHGVSRGTVEVAYYRDAMQRTTISGGGAAGPAETIPSEIPDGLLVDPTTGSFRALGPGYSTGGVRVSASAPLWSGLWVAAEYSTGRAVASETGGAATFAEAAAGLRPQTAQSATVAVKGRLNHAGTKVRASYRWQPAHVVTAVDPYGGFSDQGFLSCLLQQPIRLGSHLPQGLNATVDVTNLLAEGYRPFVSADGQTLYFAQAPRTIQAGLSFTF